MNPPRIACAWRTGWSSHTLRLEQDTLVCEQRSLIRTQRRLIPLADLDPQVTMTASSYVLTSRSEQRPLLEIRKTPVTRLAIQALQHYLAARAPRSSQEQAAFDQQLEQLEALRRAGTLSDKEYTAAKHRLLTQRTQSGFRGVP